MIFRREQKKSASPAATRVLAYCASNIGLGHYVELVRCMAALKKRRPDADILLATDARERELAERAGLARMELPGFEFIDETSFKERPRALGVDNETLRSIRAHALEGAVRAFRPDLVFMDSNPHGKRDEMLPALKRARKQGASAIMLMRDIPAPHGERHKLTGDATKMLKHAALYDKLLISSEREFFDVAAEYKWPDALKDKLEYIGFIAEKTEPLPRVELFAALPDEMTALDPKEQWIVAGFGGGWAVESAARRLMEGLAEHRRRSGRRVQMALSIGPAAGESELAALQTLAKTLGGVAVARFIPRFGALLAAADMAVLQAGFTVYQILESATPIVLAPRAHSSREQEERAARLSQLPGIRVIDPKGIDAADWPACFAWGLESEHAARKTGWRFDGAEQAADAALKLLG